MRYFTKILILWFVLLCLGCDEEALMPGTNSVQGSEEISKAGDQKVASATGDVQVMFYAQAGESNGGMTEENGSMGEGLKYAHVIFDAHEASVSNPAKGAVLIDMMNEDGLVTRQFAASVYAVLVEPELNKAKFLALVISDTKTESDDTDHDHSDGDHEEGDHEDGEHEDGDHGGNGAPKGNQSRVGQILAVTVIDGGTPGINGDLMGWKWFGNNNPNIPSLDKPSGWGSLENRVIIAGNLVVHAK